MYDTRSHYEDNQYCVGQRKLPVEGALQCHAHSVVPMDVRVNGDTHIYVLHEHGVVPSHSQARPT